jgi:sugar (pentulose or hexulose) kinase
MPLLGVDVGTTHCKAGLFGEAGEIIRLDSLPMHSLKAPSGYVYYETDEVFENVIELLRIVTKSLKGKKITSIGISSMAESGLLLERANGEARSPIIPWYDMSSLSQSEQVKRVADPLERFCKTGIRVSSKCSLIKVLWLKDQGFEIDNGMVWLSVADYIVYRLTGILGTDFSLAGRTYAFRIDQNEWDTTWLKEWGLPEGLFPPATQSGELVGRLLQSVSTLLDLPQGLPVVLAGHDHICGALGAGIIKPGSIFDSMGTAESLFGAIPEGILGEKEFASGLSFGRHVVAGQMYWMGGLSASGGSVEWLRMILRQPKLSYEELGFLENEMGIEPGEILYFPYLSGSGSPHTDSTVQAALIGIQSTHNRADLLKAIFEGTAYEIETARQAAVNVLGYPMDEVIAAGGGTRSRRWLQIKADISGCRYKVLPFSETTLLGAAILAGTGSGQYSSLQEAVSAFSMGEPAIFSPDPSRQSIYRQKYLDGYQALQDPLRNYFNSKV